MGLRSRVLHNFKITNRQDLYHFNENVKGIYILENIDEKPIKIKTIEVHIAEFYQKKVQKKFPTSTPGLMETRDVWKFELNTLNKEVLQKKVELRPNANIEIEFSISLPKKWVPKKSDSIKDWGLGLFFFHKENKNLSLGGKIERSAFLLKVGGTDPSILGSAIEFEERGYLPPRILVALEDYLEGDDKFKQDDILKKMGKEKLDEIDKIRIKTEKIKAKKEAQALKKQRQRDKLLQRQLKQKGPDDNFGMSKELKKSRKKWETEIGTRFDDELDKLVAERELKEAKEAEKEREELEKIKKEFKIESVTNKCPKCGWILSSTANKCPRCQWTKGDIVFPGEE
ncbi:MAG: zinc ribbon domain-containing protein [Promethearchaeota archaeon]